MKIQCRQVLNNPDEFFKGLCWTKYKVLEKYLSYASTCKSVYISQQTIADSIGIHRRSVNLIIKYFESIGVLVIKHRFNASNITSLSSWWALSSVQKAMRKWFKQVPKNIAILTLLFGSNITLFSTKKAILNSPLYKKDPQMEKKAAQVRGIRKALVARGVSWERDVYNLFAFGEDVLEHVSEKMKYSTKLRDPFGFMMSLCIKHCQWNSITVDWSLVEKAKELKLLDNVVVRTVVNGGTAQDSTNTTVAPRKPISQAEYRERRDLVMEKGDRKHLASLRKVQKRKWTERLEKEDPSSVYAEALREMLARLEAV
jgi:hypothetical protein